MFSNHFRVLIGLRLSIVRRAADMLVLHFGMIRVRQSIKGTMGTIGEYALHVQCPWRLDGPDSTITGRDDLWESVGPGEPLPDWPYKGEANIQNQQLSKLLGAPDERLGWTNETERFKVVSVDATKLGDVKIILSDGYSILLFPNSIAQEAWRFFAPEDERHLVFPIEKEDNQASVEQNV